MGEIAISIEQLGKRYILGEREKYLALRDVLTRVVTRPLMRLRSRSERSFAQKTFFWALRNVSLDVRRGQVVGVIGRNGAGKSTLLKILSRVTEPTEGRARILGRVGSLLEVGTGFHYELTGRENVFLSGAYLGMTKTEVRNKFDEIVNFAGVERFIDTPVKQYSSGMYTRLAFAVAAHLEPEILLMDEVLAVGDLEFQKKCLGKMGSAAKAGRTILFVSHQLNQIRRLCDRCVWLEDGKVRMVGNTVEVLSQYEAATIDSSMTDVTEFGRSNIDGAAARFLSWRITEAPPTELHTLRMTGTCCFDFAVRANQKIGNAHFGVALYDIDNLLMWANAFNGLTIGRGGVWHFRLTLPDLPLKPGLYCWKVSLYDESGLADSWYGIPPLIVGTSPVTHPLDQYQGVLNIPSELEVLAVHRLPQSSR